MKKESKRARPGYVIVWEFMVAASKRRKFEAAYGPDGVWAKFFRNDAKYGGTELLRDSSRPGRYFTVDSWSSASAYERFKRKNAAAYIAVDEKCQALTEWEAEIGRFELIRRRRQ